MDKREFFRILSVTIAQICIVFSMAGVVAFVIGFLLKLVIK